MGWFYSKDAALIFYVDIANDNSFKSFEYKAKLLGKFEGDGANEILKTTTTAVPLKYLSNFWRSLEMLLTNCKIELKVKWSKHNTLILKVQSCKLKSH